MIHRHPALVIAGSVRLNRLAVQIGGWVAAVGRETTGGAYDVVDLRDWPLPMDDEPGLPQAGDYAAAHSRAWSRRIADAPGFVFVTPQYNGGYPAALKNAIDHLYGEWAGKPALIVSYGGHGGGHAAGQLRQVLHFVKAIPIVAEVNLRLPRDVIEANAGTIDAAAQFAAHADDLRRALAAFASAL